MFRHMNPVNPMPCEPCKPCSLPETTVDLPQAGFQGGKVLDKKWPQTRLKVKINYFLYKDRGAMWEGQRLFQAKAEPPSHYRY